MAVKIFFDCGAPALFNRLSRKIASTASMKNKLGVHVTRSHTSDFSYVHTPEYREYREAYAKFLLRYRRCFETYASLDVMGSAELTYENQKYLEGYGLKPLPVWHYGTDIGWLVRYLDEGYDYLCIGGLVPNPVPVLKLPLDRIWARYLTDSSGMPVVKVHGFAVGSFQLMYRYPWYSVDAKTWLDQARFGAILMPRPVTKDKYDWLHPYLTSMTARTIRPAPPHRHIRTMGIAQRQAVLLFLERIGVPLGKSRFEPRPMDYELQGDEHWVTRPTEDKAGLLEICEERGVVNYQAARLDVNLLVYHKIEEIVPKWPWPFEFQPPEKGLFT